MKANIGFSKKDISKAFELHYNTKHPIKSRLMLLTGVAILLLGFIMFYLNFPERPEFLKHLIVLSGFGYIILYFYRRKKLFERASKLKTFEGQFTFDVNNKGISFGKESKASKCLWEDIRDVVKDEYSILFYFGIGKFYILPLEQLNATQRIDVNEMIKKHNGK